jgi:hypothetical protein
MASLIRHDVSVAYRDWLIELARREAKDCDRLRGVLAERPQCVFVATRTWPSERREALLVALAKTAQLGVEPALPTPGELEEWKRWSWSPSDREAARVLAGLRAGMVTGAFRLDRRKLRATVERALVAALGKPHARSSVLCFVSRLELVTVNTFVDTGGNYQLRYWHNVVRGAPDEPTPLVSDAIVLSNAGVSNLVGESISHWDAIREGDVDAVAGHLARLCTEFVEAVPTIVQAA